MVGGVCSILCLIFTSVLNVWQGAHVTNSAITIYAGQKLPWQSAWCHVESLMLELKEMKNHVPSIYWHVVINIRKSILFSCRVEYPWQQWKEETFHLISLCLWSYHKIWSTTFQSYYAISWYEIRRTLIIQLSSNMLNFKILSRLQFM